MPPYDGAPGVMHSINPSYVYECTREAQRAPARTFCRPMWSRRSEFSWHTYEASRRELSSFEVLGAPIRTRSPAGAPLSEPGPLIKSKWGPFGDPGAPEATVRRGPWRDAPVSKNPSYVYVRRVSKTRR